MAEPAATYTDDLYRFLWKEEGVEIILDRLHANREGGLRAELTIRVVAPFTPSQVHEGLLNMPTGGRTRSEIMKACEHRLPDSGVDWDRMLQQASRLAIAHWRGGEPVVDLAALANEPTEGRLRYLLDPVILESGLNMLYGDGDTTKSVQALFWAVAVASGYELAGLKPSVRVPVLYLDWEDDQGTHAERLRAICRGFDQPLNLTGQLHYQRHVAPLGTLAPTVRLLIKKLHIGLVIVDSLGMACGGDPRDPGPVLDAMRAARSFRVPVVFVHHLSKSEKDKSKAYGSIYATTLIRHSWYCRRSDDDQSPDQVRVRLQNYKRNRGQARQNKLAFRFFFENSEGDKGLERVLVDSISLQEVADLSGSRADQIEALMGGGSEPFSIPAIAELLTEAEGETVTESAVRALLNRSNGRFIKVGNAWALPALGESE